VEAWAFPLFLVFTMVRIRKSGLVKVRFKVCGGGDEFGSVDDDDEGLWG